MKPPLLRVSEVLGVQYEGPVRERFNIAPTSQTPIIRAIQEGGVDLVEARWGLLPAWATEPMTFSTFNARVETVATKPTYRSAWRKGRRCLVPATGIYEWETSAEGKQPYFISAMDGRELLMAGLWESRLVDELERISFTILVGPANDLVRSIHDRQAIMLSDDGARAWMQPGALPDEELMPLLVPCPPGMLQVWPVSKAVNSSREDGPDLVTPIGPIVMG